MEKYCIECGQKLLGTAKFCDHCGTAQSVNNATATNATTNRQEINVSNQKGYADSKNGQRDIKGCLSMVFFVFALVFPPISLLIGWIYGNFRTGAIAALVTFAVFAFIGGIFIVFVKSPTWPVVLAPFVLGMAYSGINFIPLPFDDVLVATFGAMVSTIIALVKYADVPKTVVIPMAAAALYTLVGEFIPGPVDELFVTIIASGVTYLHGRSATKPLDVPNIQSPPLVLDQGYVDDEPNY